MAYEGPQDSDYANVRALNEEYLRLVKADTAQLGLPADLRRRFEALGRRQLDWLAKVPFLLFSLQENDPDKWQQLLADQVNEDLFRSRPTPANEFAYLVTMTAGFLWQLAQENQYSARLFSGSPTAWCTLLANTPYVDLVSRVRQHADLLTLRDAGNRNLWTRLLTQGVSAEPDIRGSAHIAALQMLLTTIQATDSWAVAACNSRPIVARQRDGQRRQ